jgi:hypothetical protein
MANRSSCILLFKQTQTVNTYIHKVMQSWKALNCKMHHNNRFSLFHGNKIEEPPIHLRDGKCLFYHKFKNIRSIGNNMANPYSLPTLI